MTGTYGAPTVPGAISLYIWDAASGTQQLGAIERLNWPWHIDYAPDGNSMLVLGLSREPVLYDLQTMRERYRLANLGAFQVFFHPSRDRFAALGGTTGIRIMATADGRELISMSRGNCPGYFTPEGRALVTRVKDQQMHL